MALGLAVGAGYVLGRTKKMKLAFAVGTLVAGKKLPLSPRALAELVQQQLLNNPQFKEIGDQLREDVRGVGKAATGAVLERGLDGISDRLRDRTLGVQDRLSGVIPGARSEEDEDDDRARSESRDDDAASGSDEEESSRGGERSARKPASAAKSKASGTARKSTSAASKSTGAARKTTGARKTASGAKSAGGKTASRTAKKTTSAAKSAARRTTRAKGGRSDG
ncbi:DNA primase [Streptomyces indicus]